MKQNKEPKISYCDYMLLPDDEVKEIRYKEILRYNDRLRELYGFSSYMQYQDLINESGEWSERDSLTYIKYVLDKLLVEMGRLKSVSFDHEIVITEFEPGKYYAYDDVGSTRVRYPVKIMSRKEFEEYTNSRAGFKVYR